MASHIKDTKIGPRLTATRKRLDDEFSPRRWPARIVQMALGAWLFISAFLWSHGVYGFHLAWIGGLTFFVLALVSAFFPPMRLLLGLTVVWFLLATFFASEQRATLVNHFFVALFVFIMNFLPQGDVWLFRAERHRQHA